MCPRRKDIFSQIRCIKQRQRKRETERDAEKEQRANGRHTHIEIYGNVRRTDEQMWTNNIFQLQVNNVMLG